MHSPATTVATTLASPTTSHDQNERDNTPDCLPTKLPVLTQDFYLDTLFNPVWMSGPHVFSFAKDGTVVRPETYSLEPYPGHHTDRTRRLESINASHFQGKPWKNVAVTEQDDAEYAAFQARARAGAMGDWRRQPYEPPASSMLEELELVHTWPPRPYGR